MKPNVPNSENKSICAGCKKPCCHGAPGIYHPSDFGDDEEEIRSGIIDSIVHGKAQIDKWYALQDVEPFYYVRPPVNDRSGSRVDQIFFYSLFGMPCSLLGKDGCTLEHDERPLQCKAYVPAHHEGCHYVDPDFGKMSWWRGEWLAFDEFLYQLAEMSIGDVRALSTNTAQIISIQTTHGNRG